MTSAHHMSASRYEAWHRCARLHHYRYHLGYRAAKPTRAQLLGTAFHAGQEAWWRAWQAGEGGASLSEAFGAIANALGTHHDALEMPEPAGFDRMMLVALMTGYHHRWAPAMSELEVLAVEQRFELPLEHPVTGERAEGWQLVGAIDALVRRRGKVYIVEHKTTSADTGAASHYWTRLRMDPQISIYHDGARALGYEADGCLYDVVKKPTTKPITATPHAKRRYTKGKPCKPCDGEAERNPECETCLGSGWKERPRLDARQHEFDESPDEYRDRLVDDIAAAPDKYFQRAVIVRLDHELDEARRDLWQTARMIHLFAMNEIAPRNPSACNRYGGVCEFFDVCSGAAELDHNPRLVRRPRRGPPPQERP